MEVCDVCRGPLYVDALSVIQLARSGYAGARIYCRAGCTDVWLKRPLAARPVASGELETRGRYERPAHEFACETCGRAGQTRGYRTRWCEHCRTLSRRQREREAYARRRRRRGAAA